jgi:hypothetical protein
MCGARIVVRNGKRARVSYGVSQHRQTLIDGQMYTKMSLRCFAYSGDCKDLCGPPPSKLANALPNCRWG